MSHPREIEPSKVLARCSHCACLSSYIYSDGTANCCGCGSEIDWPACPSAAENPPAIASQVGGSHYKDMAIQPAEYCQRNRLGFLESSVVKYVSRHRAKNGGKNGAEDIRKAIHCLQLLLEIEYPESKPQ